MDVLDVLLPVLLYIFGIILLIVLIILGIRLIQILNKCEKVIDNVEEKINSFNDVFTVINKLSYGLSMVSDKLISSITNMVSKIFNRKKDKEEDYYE